MQIGDKILVECTNGETALGVQYEKHCPFSVKDRHDMPFTNYLAIRRTDYFDFVTKNKLTELIPPIGEQPVTRELEQAIDALVRKFEYYKEGEIKSNFTTGWTPEEDSIEYKRLLWFQYWIKWSLKNCKEPILLRSFI